MGLGVAVTCPPAVGILSSTSIAGRSERARGEALAIITNHLRREPVLGLRPLSPWYSRPPPPSLTTTLTTATNPFSARPPPHPPIYAVAPAESVSRSDDIDALSRREAHPELDPSQP